MTADESKNYQVCLIGFGEVGQILAADLHARGVSGITAWDILFADANSIPSRALSAGTARAARSAEDAVSNANVVISAVTAAQDLAAAEAAAIALAPNAFFVDLNSVSPDVKKEAARLVESRGGSYVEAAVMSPISPQRIATPMLLGGPHAARFLNVGRSLGFTGAEVFADEVGRAAAAKMCRSVVVKGFEALLTESMLAARSYGVEDTVLASLQDLFPDRDWRGLARYMISRSLLHGRRRAEEMREVARTVANAGIAPWMSAACAERQDWAAAYGEAAGCEHLEDMLDRVLAPVKTE